MSNNKIIERQKKELKQIYFEVCGFFEFVKKSPFLLFVSTLMIVLCYGIQTFFMNGYQDQQVVLMNQGTEYNWNEIGRFGFVWLRNLFGTNNHNPYFTGVLFIIFFVLASFMWLYLFRKVAKPVMGIWSEIIFVVLFVTHPILTEQYYFQFQSFEINFGLFLIPFCLVLAFEWIMNQNYMAAVLSVLGSVFAFGIYQSMVPIYILGVVISLLFLILNSSERIINYWKIIGKSVGIFLISLIIYGLLWRTFYYSSDYLNEQIGWGHQSISKVIYTIFQYAYHVLVGKGYFFTLSYLVMCILFFIIAIHAIAKKIIQKSEIVVFLVVMIGFIISPFLLVIVNGNYIFNRAQMTLPITCAAGVLFASFYVKNYVSKSYLTVFVGIISILLSLTQLNDAMRILYTHDTIAKNDELVATQLTGDLNKQIASGGNKPVVFVGYVEAKTNPACVDINKDISYSYLFDSAIQANALKEPYSYFGTLSTLSYFQTLGYSYETPSEQQVKKGVEESETIPVWPERNSIIDLGDIIVVKMSDL